MAHVDLREFNRVFSGEYMKYSKRSFAEACNQHLYYILRNAVNMTKAASKEQIEKDLTKASRLNRRAPVAALIINKKRGIGKGLYGEKMTEAIEKLIRKTQSHVNFVRAGWKQGVKAIERFVPRKGGANINNVRDRGGKLGLGGAVPAREEFRARAEGWNAVTSKNNSAKVTAIEEAGAQMAVDMETQKMREYIIKKQSEITNHLFGT